MRGEGLQACPCGLASATACRSEVCEEIELAECHLDDEACDELAEEDACTAADAACHARLRETLLAAAARAAEAVAFALPDDVAKQVGQFAVDATCLLGNVVASQKVLVFNLKSHARLSTCTLTRPACPAHRSAPRIARTQAP